LSWEETSVFFAKQVVNNACATQAILSVLMNAEDIDVGSVLTNFRDFTGPLNPELKGISIGNSDELRTAHNSFSHQHAFSLEDKPAKDDEDEVYHFISYVPFHGRLYELDGLKQGPIDLGDVSGQDWKKRATAVIGERIQRYSTAEIRFNLLAVVDSQLAHLTSQLGHLEAVKASDPSREAEVNRQLDETQMLIAGEHEKRAQWKEENIRRKHNYVPFVINLLKLLAERNELQPLVDKAVEDHTENSKKRKATKK